MPWFGWLILAGIIVGGLVLSDIFGKTCPRCESKYAEDDVVG